MEIKSVIQNKKALFFINHHPLAHPLAIAQVEEFKELGRSAGLQFLGLSYQALKKPSPATFIGVGKIQELKKILGTETPSKPENTNQLVVFNCSLSGVQIRNLEKELKVMVIDRNQLILDIFAQRARTYEGKLQVELAHALDELPRMVGAWMSSLSRQGGGIGTKGPGEQAIEKDRRLARARIKKIRKKLEKIRRVRKGHRTLRKKNNIPGIALIGYTNSGKSSLLNALTNRSSIPVQNLPFMTLDPTIRKIHIPPAQSALITDTVGFIQNLSPHLIEAFKATLEESAEADILLHVVDLSSPMMKTQMETVDALVREFGWDQKPCLYVYNKMDIATKEKMFQMDCHPKVCVSALKKIGLDQLKSAIGKLISQLKTEEVQLYFPKNEEEQLYSLNRTGLVYKKEESAEGIVCHARLAFTHLKKWENFIIKKIS